jgi:hypothetical protein
MFGGVGGGFGAGESGADAVGGAAEHLFDARNSTHRDAGRLGGRGEGVEQGFKHERGMNYTRQMGKRKFCGLWQFAPISALGWVGVAIWPRRG